MLLEDVFGYKFELRTNLIDVHLGRLRRKLDGPGEQPMLTTLRGEGFVLNAPH
jgi:two-component system OmpR family response regulator